MPGPDRRLPRPRDATPVYRTILVPYDDSDHSRSALALGQCLGGIADAELVVEDVTSRDLRDRAEEVGADLIVVDSAGRRLFHGAPCAVAVAPAGFREREPAIRVIGVGLDGSHESKAALASAVELGRAAGATLRLFAAAHPPAIGPRRPSGYPTRDYMKALRESFQDDLDAALASVPDVLGASGELLHGPAARTLAAEAGKGVDLLCVGSRGHGPLRRVLLGSVSRELASQPPCPLLVVPRGAGGPPTEETAAAGTESK